MEAWLNLFGVLGAAAIAGYFGLKSVRVRERVAETTPRIEAVAAGTGELRDVVLELLTENARLRKANEVLERKLARYESAGP